MATYKVPQDVEADDKLIGPFSFRQFIYLIAVVLAGIAAWGLGQLFIGLAIIPLPIIIFFGALALPLRKDQPMEIYMAAMVSFYLKPRLRKWDPEGVETLIEISAPKTVEERRIKDLSQTEASQRLSYLADIVDSGGWSIRGVSGVSGTAMNNDIYLEAQSAEDVLDTNTSIAHSFDKMITASTERARDEARQKMLDATKTPSPILASEQLPNLRYDPYPAFRQSILQPIDEEHHAESDIEPPAPQPTPQGPPTPTQQATPAAPVVPAPINTPVAPAAQVVAQPTPAPALVLPSVPASPQTQTPENAYKPAPIPNEKPATTSSTAISTGIMNLANNPDLSIQTIAHEAQRLQKKAEESSEEVVISLR